MGFRVYSKHWKPLLLNRGMIGTDKHLKISMLASLGTTKGERHHIEREAVLFIQTGNDNGLK